MDITVVAASAPTATGAKQQVQAAETAIKVKKKRNRAQPSTFLARDVSSRPYCAPVPVLRAADEATGATVQLQSGGAGNGKGWRRGVVDPAGTPGYLESKKTGRAPRCSGPARSTPRRTGGSEPFIPEPDRSDALLLRPQK